MSSETAPAAVTPLPLTQERCASLRWRIPIDQRHIARQPSVLLSVAELASIALELPWFFVERNGNWHAVALMRNGVGGSCPWLQANGQSGLRVLPFLLRKYPFTLLPDGPRYRLGIWQDPTCIGASGAPLFENGELAENVNLVVRAFSQFLNGVKVAHTLALALSDAGVLKPSSLPWSAGPKLMQVNEDALRELPGSHLESLNKQGALGAAHAQLLSCHHFRRLIQSDAASPESSGVVAPEENHAFFDALADDLQAGAEFYPGALSQ